MKPLSEGSLITQLCDHDQQKTMYLARNETMNIWLISFEIGIVFNFWPLTYILYGESCRSEWSQSTGHCYSNGQFYTPLFMTTGLPYSDNIWFHHFTQVAVQVGTRYFPHWIVSPLPLTRVCDTSDTLKWHVPSAYFTGRVYRSSSKTCKSLSSQLSLTAACLQYSATRDHRSAGTGKRDCECFNLWLQLIVQRRVLS